MPLYEHVFLARQDASGAQVEQLTKEFTEVLEEGGGKIARSEYWGLKSLAYKIKKSRKAHYVMLNIDGPPAAIDEMERRMRLSTDIIRFMTIRVDAHETEPSVMMRKQDRDDRGPRGPRGDRGPRSDRGPRGDRGDRGDRPPRGPRGDRPDRDARDNANAGE
jgi:small subunit ribosomal protein S6